MDDLLGGAGAAIAEGTPAGDDPGTTPEGGAPGGEGGGEGAGPGGTPGEGEGAGEGEGGIGEIGEGTPEGEGEGEEVEVDEFSSADGRAVDAKTREALAALKKVNPEAAKRLFADHGRNQAIIKEVGAQNLSDAVNKVRQMAATLESVGGEEGLGELQTEVNDWRAEADQFANGDPALLTGLHGENPEAFGTAITNGLALISEKSPEMLDNVILPTLVPRLERAGMYRSIDQLLALIQEGKGQEAYDLTADIKKWLGNAKNLADKAATTKAKYDPERQALDKEKQELASEKATIRENQIGGDVNKLNNVATARIVEPFFKDLKLKPEGRRAFLNALNPRIWDAMKKDKPFQRAAHSLKAKGDHERTARFISAKFAELLPQHFRALRNELYPSYRPGVTKPTAAGVKPNGTAVNGGAPPAKPPAGVVLVNKLPRPDEIDWSKTTEEMYHIGRGTGEAIIKGTGKRLRWNWATVQR